MNLRVGFSGNVARYAVAWLSSAFGVAVKREGHVVRYAVA